MLATVKIAICDDQQVFIDRLKNLISYEEAEIYVFNSGDKLLMSDINFDIILLDIEMPGTDGLSVAAKLYQRNRKALLLFITSYEKILKIVIENTSPYVEIKDNKIKTTKSDYIRHGYGIKSIKGALENNDGLLSLSYKNGIFVCRIIMNNNAGHENDVVCAK